MIRMIVLAGVIAAIVCSGGALADVSFKGLEVTLRRADGQLVTGRVTGTTEIKCLWQTCDQSAVKPRTIVLNAVLRRAADGVKVFKRLELGARRPRMSRRALGRVAREH